MLNLKKLAFAALLTLGSSAVYAQNSYIKIGGAYNLPTDFSYQEQVSETYNPNGATLNVTNTKQNYGQGMCFNGAYGFAFNKYFGFELGLSYVLNSKNISEYYGFTSGYGTSSEYHFNQETYSRMLLIQPSIVASLGRERANPYIRVGLVLPNGKIITNETYTEYNLNVNRKMETKGAFRIGFQNAFGLELEARKNVFLCTEITFTNLSFVPTNRTVVNATVNEKDIMYNLTVRDRETEFVETVNQNYSYDRNTDTFKPINDPNTPTQEAQKNYTMNTIGLGLGLKFKF